MYVIDEENRVSPQPGNVAVSEEPLRVLDWLLMQLVALLPVVGLVFLLIWAFDRGGTQQRRKFARASLLLRLLVLLPLLLILAVVFFSMFGTFASFLFL